jgi:hypothetical protein
LSFSVITDDLTLSSKDQNVFCIVNCKEDYDNLKLACKPIFQKINRLCEKASIEVEVSKLNYVSVFTASYHILYKNNAEFACVIKA